MILQLFPEKKMLTQYKNDYNNMSRAALMCELLDFHQQVKDRKNFDKIKARALLEVLKSTAFTPAMKDLATKYLKVIGE